MSLEVSPLLAYDAEATVAQAKRLHAQGDRPNLFIKIPGTPEGLPAVEEAIAAGVPVNVTLLFSPAQYLACAEAYTRGIERRVEAGLPAYVASVASLFISRWDPATAKQLPDDMQNEVGLAIGRQSYVDVPSRSSRPSAGSGSWPRGRSPQRLLFASTGTKDPSLPSTLYITGLAAPDTVNTMPEETLLATGASEEAVAGLDAEAPDQLARFTAAGLDIDAIAGAAPAQGRRVLRGLAGPRCWSGSPPRSQRSPEHRARLREVAGGAGRAVRRASPRATPMAQRRKMFGYPALFVGGNMATGLFADRWVVRLAHGGPRRASWRSPAPSRSRRMPGRPMSG